MAMETGVADARTEGIDSEGGGVRSSRSSGRRGRRLWLGEVAAP